MNVIHMPPLVTLAEANEEIERARTEHQAIIYDLAGRLNEVLLIKGVQELVNEYDNMKA